MGAFFETDAVLINYNLDVSSGWTTLGIFHKSNNSDWFWGLTAEIILLQSLLFTTLEFIALSACSLCNLCKSSPFSMSLPSKTWDTLFQNRSSSSHISTCSLLSKKALNRWFSKLQHRVSFEVNQFISVHYIHCKKVAAIANGSVKGALDIWEL